MLIKPKIKGSETVSKKSYPKKNILIIALIIGLLTVISILSYKYLNSKDPVISFGNYEKLLAEDKVESAVIIKTGDNDYYFNATLRYEEIITQANREIRIKKFRVFLPEPLLKDHEAIWKAKGVPYTFEAN